MKLTLTITGLIIACAMTLPRPADAKGDGFNEVVKCIEQFYRVKRQNLPLLARAGVKAVRTGAKIRGGQYKKLAEAGSMRIAFFEEQTFDSRGQMASFRTSIQNALAGDWSELVQTLAAKDEEQNYVYIRDAGQKFHVLVIDIERHDATVIEATLSPQVLADLLKSPENIGKELSDEATRSDP